MTDQHRMPRRSTGHSDRTSRFRRALREEAEGEFLVNIRTRMPGSSAPVP